ncbi:MAG TPA: 6-carboxytetrahydropterin synthase [Methanobacteriaceae archaeon]|jgi:6-pyruvoyltetrahydropterin/6-carboxytetrahydropterin synthase|nr:6-carboxytetrahydropterin synthase [Methanobacteriaceae archaeon]HNS25813.1 6-carboxytetrahydropterin synthase [Methanobacteriaceae archaeon]
MKIVINGIHANLRFASAHMIPGHEFCGGIHGHSYHVDVVVEGERSGQFGFVVDFKAVKAIVRKLCKKLDHKVLLPLESDQITFTNMDESLEFSIGSKNYVLPNEDCCLLPITSTSAEELSRFFAHYVHQALEDLGVNIEGVEICVNEGIGQGAHYTFRT